MRSSRLAGPVGPWALVLVLIAVGAILSFSIERRASSTPRSLPSDSKRIPGTLQAPSSAQLDVLSTGLEAEYDIERALVAPATGREGIWYVGARLSTAGRPDQLALWALSGSQKHPGLMFSMGDGAQSASVWPSAQKSRLSVSEVDPEALSVLSTLRERPSGPSQTH